MTLTRLPGLIDVHVHLREPGATYKEDFETGSRAAVKGGFTYILDMPNNPIPTVTPKRLWEKIALADAKAVCTIGFHYGTTGGNLETFESVWDHPRVFGLKIYCNHTTGELLVEDPVVLEKIFRAWESPKPILVHAEGERLYRAIELAQTYGRKLHACHISLAEEVELIAQAKRENLPVSAGVCPHHLYLTSEDLKTLGVRAMMKPPLGNPDDQEALWEGLRGGTIDVVETDHAPHLLAEKESGTAQFGVPGLETALSLMIKATQERRLPKNRLVHVMHYNPKKIFNIPDQPDTFVEVGWDATYTVGDGGYETKCGWSPFEGWELPGKIKRVVIAGKERYAGGAIL